MKHLIHNTMKEILWLRNIRKCSSLSSIMKEHVDSVQRALWVHYSTGTTGIFIDSYNQTRVGDLANCKLLSGHGEIAIKLNDNKTIMGLYKERL